MAPNWLSEEEKIFLIAGHADYLSLGQISKAFEETFGRPISTSHVAAYHPERSTGGKPAKKWCELFETFREEVNRRLLEIPISNRIYRLKMLQMIVDQNWQKNPKEAREAMMQAREELGQVEDRPIDLNIRGQVSHAHLHAHEIAASQGDSSRLHELSDDAYSEILGLIAPPRPSSTGVSDDAPEEQVAATEVGVGDSRDLDS